MAKIRRQPIPHHSRFSDPATFVGHTVSTDTKSLPFPSVRGLLNVECQRCYTETNPKNRETQKKRRQEIPRRRLTEELKKGKHFGQPLGTAPSSYHRSTECTKQLKGNGPRVFRTKSKKLVWLHLSCAQFGYQDRKHFRVSLPCPQEDPSSSEATRKGKGPRQDGPLAPSL